MSTMLRILLVSLIAGTHATANNEMFTGSTDTVSNLSNDTPSGNSKPAGEAFSPVLDKTSVSDNDSKMDSMNISGMPNPVVPDTGFDADPLPGNPTGIIDSNKNDDALPTNHTGETRPTDLPSILTGVTRSTDEPTILTGVTRSTDEPTILTGVTRSTDVPTILTGETRSTDEPTILTGVTRSTYVPTILTGVTRSSIHPKPTCIPGSCPIPPFVPNCAFGGCPLPPNVPVCYLVPCIRPFVPFFPDIVDITVIVSSKASFEEQIIQLILHELKLIEKLSREQARLRLFATLQRLLENFNFLVKQISIIENMFSSSSYIEIQNLILTPEYSGLCQTLGINKDYFMKSNADSLKSTLTKFKGSVIASKNAARKEYKSHSSKVGVSNNDVEKVFSKFDIKA